MARMALNQWMRNNTSHACETSPHYMVEWASDAEAVAAVARDGTRAALSYLSSRFIEQFQLNYLSSTTMLKAIEQGLLVGLSELRGILYLARRVPYTERGPAFVLSEADAWDDQLLENLSEDEDARTYDEIHLDPGDDSRFILHDEARQVLPTLAQVVGIPTEDDGRYFYAFVQGLEPLFRTTTGHTYHTYVEVLDILLSRITSSGYLPRGRDELRRLIARWNLPDVDALFEPPCGLK